MIQRIQSLYLLLTTLLPLLFLKQGILIFVDSSGSEMKVNLSGIYNGSGLIATDWMVTFVIVLIAVLSAVIFFLFRKRDLQLKLSRILVFLVIGFIIGFSFYSYSLIIKYNAEIKPVYTLVVPVLQLLFSYLAYRGIKKDDDLVKSYDRLR